MQVQYSSDQSEVCSQPGIGTSSQNLVPILVKAWVWAMARAILTPSTSTLMSSGCVKYPAWKIGLSYGLLLLSRTRPLDFGLSNMGMTDQVSL